MRYRSLKPFLSCSIFVWKLACKSASGILLSRALPLETRSERIVTLLHSYKFHMTFPFQAFGHGLTVYWETVRVTGTNVKIQHAECAPFSPLVVCHPAKAIILRERRRVQHKCLAAKVKVSWCSPRSGPGQSLSQHKWVCRLVLCTRVSQQERRGQGVPSNLDHQD